MFVGLPTQAKVLILRELDHKAVRVAHELLTKPSHEKGDWLSEQVLKVVNEYRGLNNTLIAFHFGMLVRGHLDSGEHKLLDVSQKVSK